MQCSHGAIKCKCYSYAMAAMCSTTDMVKEDFTEKICLTEKIIQ